MDPGTALRLMRSRPPMHAYSPCLPIGRCHPRAAGCATEHLARADWRSWHASWSNKLRCSVWTWALRGTVTFAAAAAGLSTMTTVQAHPAGTDPSVREVAWIAKASVGVDPRALATLSRVNGLDRRLLALRAYLRAGDTLAARWSWSQQQLAAYPSTPEGIAAAADIDTVERAFASAN